MPISNYIPSSRISQSGVCTSTTRPASPYEGQVIYETDTDRVLVWNASAWVMPNSTTANPPGMELVKTVTVGSGATTIPVTDAFSANYDNYRIMYTGGTCTGQNDLLLTLGSTVTGYGHIIVTGSYSTSPVLIMAGTGNSSSWSRAGVAEPDSPYLNLDIINPFLARRTIATGDFMGSDASRVGGSFSGYLADTNSYTSFTITVGGGFSVTGGTVRVYGYRK